MCVCAVLPSVGGSMPVSSGLNWMAEDWLKYLVWPGAPRTREVLSGWLRCKWQRAKPSDSSQQTTNNPKHRDRAKQWLLGGLARGIDGWVVHDRYNRDEICIRLLCTSNTAVRTRKLFPNLEVKPQNKILIVGCRCQLHLAICNFCRVCVFSWSVGQYE